MGYETPDGFRSLPDWNMEINKHGVCRMRNDGAVFEAPDEEVQKSLAAVWGVQDIVYDLVSRPRFLPKIHFRFKTGLGKDQRYSPVFNSLYEAQMSEQSWKFLSIHGGPYILEIAKEDTWLWEEIGEID